jgi:D-alanyl-D-alanine carboxypeptidase
MKKNAWKYGFVMSYPAGRTKETCYGYEPWHYRYVGKEAAQEIRDRGITLREYLWERQ